MRLERDTDRYEGAQATRRSELPDPVSGRPAARLSPALPAGNTWVALRQSQARTVYSILGQPFPLLPSRIQMGTL